MGADVRYRVRVLIAAEDVIEVSARTESEAGEKAKALPGVICVVGIDHPAESD